jgi:hypothetical protein
MRFRLVGSRVVLAMTLAMLIAMMPGLVARAGANAEAPPTWEKLKTDIVGTREILDSTGIVTLEATLR